MDNFNLVAWEKNNMEEKPNYDWGVYNAISNGRNTKGLWRTLTIEEWKYIINTRENASDKWGIASIDGMNGLVILPRAVFLHATSAGDYGLLYNARGHYWSSSTFIVYDYEYAQCFYFHSATIGFYVEDRPALCSVRLVQDVKE